MANCNIDLYKTYTPDIMRITTIFSLQNIDLLDIKRLILSEKQGKTGGQKGTKIRSSI